MTEAEIGGLHVRQSGHGMPVVLVHAFPVDSRMYEAQLDARFDGFSVVAPDLPGFGRSPARAVRSVDDYADAVVAVLDALEAERAVVGGTSMGGYVTMAVLRRAARRVAGVVLADTRAGADSEEARRGREESARTAETQGSGPIVDGLVPRLLGPRTLESRPDVVERVRRMGAEADPGGLAAALRAMAKRPDSIDTLADVKVPALVVVGADDAITPLAEAEAMHGAMGGSRLEVIAGAGHLTAMEAPQEFNAALGSFLGSL